MDVPRDKGGSRVNFRVLNPVDGKDRNIMEEKNWN